MTGSLSPASASDAMGVSSEEKRFEWRVLVTERVDVFREQQLSEMKDVPYHDVTPTLNRDEMLN